MTPDIRATALEAAQDWALNYPIGAWALAYGDAAEKLAAVWAEQIVRHVVDGAARRAWIDGVRWAAAEADAQAAGREPVAMADVTDHLRACADNPERRSAVPRDQAPTKYMHD
jgi:hypothetical protein